MFETKKSWICLVCGYIHQSDSPPEVCPICGAPDTEFELHETTKSTQESIHERWRCIICGYVHQGNNPPEACPVCAAPADDFEPLPNASPQIEEKALSKQKILILGGGIAGVSAAEHARKTAPDADIYLYTKEAEPPYYRLNLTRYLANEISADMLPIHPQSWYEEQNIQLRCNEEVLSINPKTHSVELSDKRIDTYDKLILACGAHSFIPPIPGANKQRVRAIRTRADVEFLVDTLKKDVPCVCIGGGILGLEVAGALAKRGAAVTLLESFDYLLPRQLNREASQVLERYMASLRINIRKQVKTLEVCGNESVDYVLLDSGEKLPAGIVTITTGIRPNTHLARRAGLQVNNGIVVDAQLRTSSPDIFAAGDAAEWNGMVYGLWEPARYQGSIAGQNAAGNTSEFGGIPRMNTLKVLGIDLFSIGVISPEDGSYIEIAAETEGGYRRFLFHDNHLVGAILIGDTKIASAIVRVVKESTDMSALLADRPGIGDIVAYLSAQ